MTTELLSKQETLLEALPAVAKAAGIPVTVLRVSLDCHGGECAASICVDGKNQAEERKFKRAVESAIADKKLPELPTFRVRGHHHCAYHFIGK